MSDIATKLQSLSRWLRQLATHEPEPECKASHTDCANDCEEAADEIDRLRAANRYLIDMHDAVMDDARKYTAAQSEIARLREALAPFAEIAHHFPKHREFGNRPWEGVIYAWHTSGFPDAEMTVEHVHAARAALETK